MLTPDQYTSDRLDALMASRRLRRGVWVVTSWPTCDEATVTFQRSDAEWVDWDAPFNTDRSKYEHSDAPNGLRPETNEQRAARRAMVAVRRYCRHNRLDEMVTFTFRGDTPVWETLSTVIDNFWKRWTRATNRERGPYVWVTEWGNLNHRLHIHMAVPWWNELQCTEVCPRCDRYEVLTKYPRAISDEALCVGCIWGHGFVGRPLRDDHRDGDNSDGRGLSLYLAKYMSKELGASLDSGSQRYRVGQGHQPTSIKYWTSDFCEAIVLASTDADGTIRDEEQPPLLSTPKISDGWQGPPVVLLDWRSQIGESVCSWTPIPSSETT